MRAEMKPLSEEVKIRRWKMIGHILRQNRESDGNVAMGTGKEKKKRETYDNVKKDRREIEEKWCLGLMG